VSSVTPSPLAPKSLTLIGVSPAGVSAVETVVSNDRASAMSTINVEQRALRGFWFGVMAVPPQH
jgi:hypothetical protein